MKPGVEITAQRAREFEIQAQQPGETEMEFRNRVFDELRSNGHLIEAHEALNNALHDDPEGGVFIGLTGEVVQVMRGDEPSALGGKEPQTLDEMLAEMRRNGDRF